MAISPDAGDIHARWENDEFRAAVFADQLTAEADTAKVVGTFEDDYYKGMGAITENKLGKGLVCYYGSAFSQEAVTVFFRRLGVIDPFREFFDLSEELELAVREKDGVRYAFILNYTSRPQSMHLGKDLEELFTGNVHCGDVTVEGYGVRIYKF